MLKTFCGSAAILFVFKEELLGFIRLQLFFSEAIVRREIAETVGFIQSASVSDDI
ncbi:hypothetical protein D3C86_1446920 [compost metagenome]